MVKCNGCYRLMCADSTVGGEYFRACGSCIKKVAIKFFNGSIDEAMKFTRKENYKRLSAHLSRVKESQEIEEGDEIK